MTELDTFDHLKYRIERTKHGVAYYNSLGQVHRLDGPAVESAAGGKYWYVDGQLHR